MLPRIWQIEAVRMVELPFTRDQFFQVFADYNAACWPAVVVAYAAAAAIVVMVGRPGPRTGRFVAAILAGMWIWVGIVYHGLFFSRINTAAYIFAGAFVLQGALFAAYALGRNRLRFEQPGRLRRVAGWLMIAYAMVAYPVIGLLAGETWPALPLFGVTPCPLLIFTFGLMLLAGGVRWWLWIVPLVWSVIGGSAALLLAVPQDWALLGSALLVLAIAARDRVAAGAGGAT